MSALPACPGPASSRSCATPSRRGPETPQRSRSTIAPPSAISTPAAEEQARKIGAAIRTVGVTVDRVLASQWCRCRDTARLLGLGPVEDLPALNSFFRNRTQADTQRPDSGNFCSACARCSKQMIPNRYHTASMPQVPLRSVAALAESRKLRRVDALHPHRTRAVADALHRLRSFQRSKLSNKGTPCISLSNLSRSCIGIEERNVASEISEISELSISPNLLQ